MVKDKIRPSLEEIKPYVPGKNPDVETVIKLASNENPLGPSKKAMSAIRAGLKKINIYPDQHALLLKDALSRKLGVSPAHIIVGNGSDEIMQFVTAAFLNAREQVITSKHTFSTYEFVTRVFDGEPLFAETRDRAHSLDEISGAVTLTTKLIFLCNPNNPTGTIFTHKQLVKFLNQLPKGVIVVLDEAYREYVESKDFPDSLALIKEGRDIIVLRTFSKIYGLAALRVGYGIARPEIIKYLNLVKLPFNVNGLAQIAGAAALKDTAHVKRSIKNNKAGKKYLYKELDALGLDYKKTEANFIFVSLKQNADEMFLNLMRKGVIIRPLTSFGLPQAIRVTVGTPAQNKKFVEALKKVL
ncbi:MAG: histidinol-phosphate transaminase [Candidatus Margulisbacteria bacterium]|nr:histidinol-phosphate transaminase [Candidatus Margulisiibacteriota bacterium]MBU1021966.1 histidinol-phosphate transaminase [Candidatus Margulisiibacteriota bacterium]MBU1728945.1 histidinol-phosphate transaminase [Candidatus Margulisiibacteriota bacterium]MBU1954751.1 histidinol-phosphate transaminase [Candidatus Margulisiibacteriota bacterium]